MSKWDEHNLKYGDVRKPSVMSSVDETHGIVGVGLAKILGLCEKLKLKKCSQIPAKSKKEEANLSARNFGDLGKEDLVNEKVAIEPEKPRLDLLAATASGAPNVVSFFVDEASQQGVKEYDDAFVGMNFKLAQQLLFGRSEKQATGVVLQLHHTDDMDKVRIRLNSIFKEKNWDLEVRDLLELQPFYKQAVGMFTSIFSFIAVIMAVIVLFTVVNTMTMSVMERTNEIGTLRAIGVKRKGITEQFVLEGSILGMIGASLGIILGSIIGTMVNNSGFMWLPPGQAEAIPLRVLTTGVSGIIFSIWLGLVIMATVAAWIPARRASKMKVVDALGHI